MKPCLRIRLRLVPVPSVGYSLAGTPETPVAPARLARRTKEWSKETEMAPRGLLLRWMASTSSIRSAVSARAAAKDGLSSVCTFLRPSNFVNASRTAASLNPCRLRRTSRGPFGV